MLRSSLKIAWVGRTNAECAPLLDRLQQVCYANGTTLNVDQFQDMAWNCSAAGDADRIVIACDNRLDYPWQLVAQLQSAENFVPWGVVTGQWHAGERRTGIGPLTHWQVPWFRWWDGWYSWFFPERARPGALCPTQFDAITLPLDLANVSQPAVQSNAQHAVQRSAQHAVQNVARRESGDAGRSRSAAAVSAEKQQLWILASCGETGRAWQMSAAQVGWAARWFRPDEVLGSAITTQAELLDGRDDAHGPSHILWDDSCQDRLPSCRATEQSLAQCGELARRFPTAPLVAGLALGHLSAWPQLRAAGVSDFFVKPSFGLPLADYLYWSDRYQGARTG